MRSLVALDLSLSAASPEAIFKMLKPARSDSRLLLSIFEQYSPNKHPFQRKISNTSRWAKDLGKIKHVESDKKIDFA